MAINVAGFDGTMTEGVWAKLMAALGTLGYKHGVVAGCAVTPGAGARQSSVAAGELLLPGLRVESTATTVLTHNANSGSGPRTDLVVARADWATNTVSFAVVQGTSATPPGLTQVPGTRWEMPLAQVTVPAGYNSAFTSTHIKAVAPVRLPAAPIRGTVDTSKTVAYNADAKTVATVEVPDPGRGYYLRVTANIEFDAKGSGYARLRAELGDGTQLEVADSGPLSAGRATAHLVGRPSLPLTGSQQVLRKLVALQMSAGDAPMSMTASAPAGLTHVTVEQLPV